jgi:hypothetical protein
MRIAILLTTTILLALVGGNQYSSAISLSGFSPQPEEATGTAAQGAIRFSSAYTALTKCGSGMTKKEEKEAEARGSDLPMKCRGYDGYYVDVSYSACASSFTVERGETSISLGMQALNFPQKTVEWRLANGKPFAVIMRVYEYAGTENCAMAGKITKESLIVRGLKGFERIESDVDVKSTPNPNVRARELADHAYAKANS